MGNTLKALVESVRRAYKKYFQSIRLNKPLWWFNETKPQHATVGHHHDHRPWWQVLWLTGVDYFSTLAYQPGIAFLAAGVLSPFATIILVLVTLFGALPVYNQVASRSFAGQGSIAMLERMLSGWWSKFIVLILLGFAITDFIITMTLSAADAAQHIAENPVLSAILPQTQMNLTFMMLLLLGLVFLIGFREAIRLAMVIAIPYIALNLVVLIAGLIQISHNPTVINNWSLALHKQGDITGILILCALVFPKLALGLSGFETGVSAMTLIQGEAKVSLSEPPHERIKSTRKLLTTAALIMSLMLVLSSFVTTLLIDAQEFLASGKAHGRAISFLAHEIFGAYFGTVYDISTVLILWFAGASAMTGLLQIIPRYLPKFGMAPDWVGYNRPLVLLLTSITLIITWIFKANVEAQSGAYATGVLVLILSAACAVALSLYRESKKLSDKNSLIFTYLKCGYFWMVTLVFTYTLLDNILQRMDGIIVASSFIAIIILMSMISRSLRATEVRVDEMNFHDDASMKLWAQIISAKVHLVAINCNNRDIRRVKETQIRQHYYVSGPLVFVHIQLADDRSDFIAHLSAKITREESNYVIEIKGANAIANTLAFVCETLKPKNIFLSLTRKNPLGQSLRFLLWGEGETGIMVYRILLKQWEATNKESSRPFIFLMSS